MKRIKKSVFLKALCFALLVSLAQIPPISAAHPDRAMVDKAASSHAAGNVFDGILLAENTVDPNAPLDLATPKTQKSEPKDEKDDFIVDDEAILAYGCFINRRGETLGDQWVKFKGQTYKTDKQGRPIKNQFVSDGDKIFLTGKDGQILHGVYRYQGTLYLLDDNTGEVRTDGGWVKSGKYHYFVKKDGEVLHNQFVTTNNKTYYVGADGTRQYGDLVINGKVFHMDPQTGVYTGYDKNIKGAKASSNQPISSGTPGKDPKEEESGPVEKPSETSSEYKMYRVNGRVFFLDRDGNYCENRFCSNGKDIYLVGSKGEALKGVYRFKGKLFLLDIQTGILHQDNQLTFNKGKIYYPQSTGILLQNQFKTIGKDTYYFGNDGSMQYGTLKLNGHVFYMDPSTGALSRYELSNGQTQIPKPPVTEPDKSKQPIPDHDPRVVVDLSYYQRPENIDYDALADDISGAVLRAGYTGYSDGRTTYEDTAFNRHYHELKKRGARLGAYWYSGASTYSQGVNEAQEALRIIGGRALDLPVYWDTEDEYHQRPASRQALTEAAKGFLSTIRAAGYQAGIYGSANWLENELDMDQLEGYETWVAHYGVARPRYRRSYKMWQFTNNYRVDGIDVPVDGSRRY